MSIALLFVLINSVFAQDSGKLNLVKPTSILSWGNLDFALPIPNAKITSPFGYREDAKIPGSTGGGDSIHMGLDLIPPDGTSEKELKRTKILASEEGEAIIVYPAPHGKYKGHSVYGGCVEIRHLAGVVNGHNVYAYTLYGHMKDVWVVEGQKIAKGEPIGLMGATGQATGPHVHFEILFDPLDLLDLSSAQ